ncbi:MAG: hypothetical protein NTX71_12245 [Candidatus Aureabacteria bacterium]|nr:hypothetical protein [Candidatus Auribacterota bacterium]
MNTTPWPRGRIDTILSVALRLLLVMVFTLAGAWAATVIPSMRGRVPLGAAVGFALIAVCFLKEKSILAFCRKHSAPLSLAGILIYVALLGLATYSELFDLGWFDWLSM